MNLTNNVLVDVKYYSFEYRDTNHSVFRGKLAAVSDKNLYTQLESLLYNRYRRKKDVSKVSVVEITKEVFDAGY